MILKTHPEGTCSLAHLPSQLIQCFAGFVQYEQMLRLFTGFQRVSWGCQRN